MRQLKYCALDIPFGINFWYGSTQGKVILGPLRKPITKGKAQFMKKICMLAYTHSADPRIRREAEALLSRGDTVDFICLRGPGEKKHEIVNGVNLYRLSIKRYRGSSILSYIFSYLSFFILAFFKLNSLYFKKRYDVIQIHTLPDFLVFVALIPKLFGAKVILDLHDLMPELYAVKFEVSKKHLMIRIIKWAEKLSTRYADHVITVTDLWKEKLTKRAITSSKCTVLMNVADGKIFNRDERVQHHNKDGFKLIYHGTLTKRYGVDVAVKAIDIVKKKIPNIRFDIIGTGEQLEELLDLIERLKAEKYIYISKPIILREQLAKRIAQADVGVVPNRADGFADEVLNTKFLEYVAMGIPAIVARTKGIKAYFSESMASFFQPQNEKDLAKCILELYHNPAKRKKLALNANKLNKKYNWNQQKEVYYNLIDNLCHR